MQAPMRKGAQYSLLGLIAFAAVSLPLGAIQSVIAIYLPRHFASHVGISLAAVGGTFAIVRLLDIWVDLFLGLAMDRTKSRWGRYRLWLIAGVPVVMLSVYMLFINANGISTATLILWLLLLYLGISMLLLAHAAWAATLVSTYHERSRVFGVVAAVSVVGSVMIFLSPVLLEQLGQVDEQAVPMMGWLIIVATPIAVAVVLFSTNERIRPNLETQRFSMRDYWELLTRPTMRRILLADFCFALGPGWLSATLLFLLVDARSFSLSQANTLLAISMASSFLGALALSWLAMRWSKHLALMLAAFGYVAALVSLLVVPQGAVVLMGLNLALLGFCSGAFFALIRAMTADVSDEIRLEKGQERAGLLYAIIVLTTKAAGAFSIFMTFTVLDLIGYDAAAGPQNTPDALRGLEFASIAGPVAFVFLGAVCLFGYDLTAQRHDEIRRVLDARDGEADPAS